MCASTKLFILKAKKNTRPHISCYISSCKKWKDIKLNENLRLRELLRGHVPSNLLKPGKWILDNVRRNTQPCKILCDRVKFCPTPWFLSSYLICFPRFWKILKKLSKLTAVIHYWAYLFEKTHFKISCVLVFCRITATKIFI